MKYLMIIVVALSLSACKDPDLRAFVKSCTEKGGIVLKQYTRDKYSNWYGCFTGLKEIPNEDY